MAATTATGDFIFSTGTAATPEHTSGLFICTLCNKPFRQETTRDRHEQYCRRRGQQRRAPRPKACQTCRRGKVKCDFASPCSTCKTRGVKCNFETIPQQQQRHQRHQHPLPCYSIPSPPPAAVLNHTPESSSSSSPPSEPSFYPSSWFDLLEPNHDDLGQLREPDSLVSTIAGAAYPIDTNPEVALEPEIPTSWVLDSSNITSNNLSPKPSSWNFDFTSAKAPFSSSFPELEGLFSGGVGLEGGPARNASNNSKLIPTNPNTALYSQLPSFIINPKPTLHIPMPPWKIQVPPPNLQLSPFSPRDVSPSCRLFIAGILRSYPLMVTRPDSLPPFISLLGRYFDDKKKRKRTRREGQGNASSSASAGLRRNEEEEVDHEDDDQDLEDEREERGFRYDAETTGSRSATGCRGEKEENDVFQPQEPLANCITISQLFVTMKSTTEKFFWRTFNSELERIEHEVPNFGAKDLIAAAQAMLIYIIIGLNSSTSCGSSSNSKSPDSGPNRDMLIIFRQIYQRFGQLYPDEPFSMPETDPVEYTCEEWIFHETRRRIVVVFFLLRLVLSPPSTPAPDSFFSFITTAANSLPLPGCKLLWESGSRSQWQARRRWVMNNFAVTEGDEDISDWVPASSKQQQQQEQQQQEKGLAATRQTKKKRWSRSRPTFYVLGDLLEAQREQLGLGDGAGGWVGGRGGDGKNNKGNRVALDLFHARADSLSMMLAAVTTPNRG